MENEFQDLKVQLNKVIFFNEKTNFLIGLFKDLDKKKTFTAKGTLTSPAIGSTYKMVGKEVVHEKYGKQVDFYNAEPFFEEDQSSLMSFLINKEQASLSKKQAEKLLELFPENLLNELFQNPQRIEEADFLKESQKKKVVESISNYVNNNSFVIDLLKFGLGHKEIEQIKNRFSHSNIREVLIRDPFDPYYKIHGFGYLSSSKIANGMNLSGNDIRRIRALIYETFRQLVYSAGDTWVSERKLLEKVRFVSPAAFQKSISDLEEMELIRREGERIFPKTLYNAEWVISRCLKEHLSFGIRPVNRLDEKIEDVEAFFNIEYDAEQKKAIETFFENPLILLNGGPGTGKSTVVQGIVRLIEEIYPKANMALCAPTGRAAKRMEEITKEKSKTIHSLLQWNFETNHFNKSEIDPLELDFLIVDESSMIDTHLFSSLLLALPETCRILYIGDEYQLESVGPGRVLNDIVESGKLPIVSLKTVHRTRNDSTIPLLAKSIKEGTHLKLGSDITYKQIPDEKIVSFLHDKLEENMDESIQLLAPMYDGPAGIRAINRMSQELYNPFHPSKAQIVLKNNLIFRVGDKILLKKNMSEQEVYNGDIGKITAIDLKTRTVTVNFDGREVEFSEDLPSYLSHAWCISIHKSQGSEYQRVICVFPENSRHMLNKRLIYTAVSRAKKNLEIIAGGESFSKGISQEAGTIRHTALKERLDSVFV